MAITVESQCAHRDELGEAPHWDAATQTLLWVDIEAGTVHRLHPDTGQRHDLRLAPPLGFAIPTSDDEMAIAVQHNIEIVDAHTQRRRLAVVEDGIDIAGMGGLMGTAMSSRNFSGAIIDGGVRDVSYLKKIGFPVYALGIVPSTSVTHYRFAGANIPVVCDGVPVSAGDIVAADADGVVVVPRAVAPQVLQLAKEMDFKEHSMYAYIEKLKSIEEAVAKFGRL